MVYRLLRKYGIRVVHSAAHSPSTNGTVERGNRTLGEMLTTWMDLNGKHWPDGLTEFCWAINSASTRRILGTPYELVFRDTVRVNSEQQQQQPSAFVPTHLRGSAKVLVEHRGGPDAGLITEDPEPLADDEVFAPDVPDSDDDDVVAEIDSSLARRAGSELSGGLAAGAAPRITRPTS